MPIQANLGHAHSIELSLNQENTEIFTMHVLLLNGDSLLLSTKREALRGLWSYLTQILYPRAVGITKRIETVVNNRHGVSPNVTYRIAAYGDAANPNEVVIGGFTRGTYWNLRLERGACENLWASLEDHLDQV